MQYALTTIAVLNFASFFWSVLGVFKNVPEKALLNYRLLQLNSILLWASLVYAVLNVNLSIGMFYLCFSIQIVCAILFWKHSKLVKKNSFSIVFSKDVPKILVKDGLYKRIRHPFYTIYLVTYASLALATLDIASLFLTSTIAFLYYNAAKFEETKFQNSSFAIAYEAYKVEAGMFVPKFPWKQTS